MRAARDSACQFTGRVRLVDRVVTTGLLVSLLTKLAFFIAGFEVYRQLPLRDPFFPPWLQSTTVYLVVYLGSVALAAASLVIAERRRAIIVRGLLLAAMFVLCIHQQTYNDVTFLTGFWTVAWSMWLAVAMGRHEPDELLHHGTTLSLLVISLIFFGGAVGKLTPGYWNGEVLYGIYFESRDFWFFNLLRSLLDEEGLRTFAAWYSRAVLATELVCSFVWLMPPRAGSLLALIALLGIAVMSNPLLLSVIACLAGLALVGLLAPRAHEESNSRDGESQRSSRIFRRMK